MSSLVATKVKTNMSFVSVKLFIVHTTFVPLFTLNWYNNNYNNNLLTSLFLAHNYSLLCSQHFCKHWTYSLDLHNTRSSNTQTQLVTRLTELLLTHWSLYLTLLYAHVFSLQNILKVESFRSRLLETSIATACICAFSHLPVPHACCC